MRQITRYQAKDGSEWQRESDAIDRDNLCRVVDEAIGGFSRTEGIPHGQWVQRSKDELYAVRRRLWAIVLKIHGDDYPKWRQANPDDVEPMSGVGRVLDDSGGPLAKAWSMLARFNFDNCREYDQPFFAINPERSEGEWIQ